MSESQADRAESTVKDRSKEKSRRKGLLERNRLYKRGFRDSKNPLSYGKDAASVRIAQIMADAATAKADAEARIKADDTLNDHQKDIELAKVNAEIDADAAEKSAVADATEGDKNRESGFKIAEITADAIKAKADAEARVKADDRLSDREKAIELAAALAKINAETAENLAKVNAEAALLQREFDAEEGAQNRQSAEKVAGVAQDAKDREARQADRLLQERALEAEIASQQLIKDNSTDFDERQEADRAIKTAREKLSKLRNEELGDAATESSETEGEPAEVPAEVPAEEATVYTPKQAEELMEETEEKLLNSLNTAEMDGLFNDSDFFQMNSSDLIDLYEALKLKFTNKTINDKNISFAGPYIYSKLGEWLYETLDEFEQYRNEPADHSWFTDIPKTSYVDIYNFFKALELGQMPPALEGVNRTNRGGSPSGRGRGGRSSADRLHREETR